MTKINIAKSSLSEYVLQNTVHEIIIAPSDAAQNEAPVNESSDIVIITASSE